jgi:hypothetical protein
MAQSAFSAQGFAMREGAIEGEALRHHFERSYGAAYPTIVAGAHLGGLITYDVIERFPESFDGALAIGGTGMPKLEFLRQRAFDLRLLFDDYYPGGLPGSVVEFPDGVGFLRYRESAQKAVAEHPERAVPLLDIFQLANVEELAICVSLYSSILQDLYVNRAHGNAFDNANTVYSGAGKDGTLNREIPRHRADPEAVAYVKSWNTPTCALSRPLLAVNALYDPIVPVQYTPHYAEACERSGNSELFVQMWMDQASPIPSLEGFLSAFRALDRWIRGGERPAPGELMPSPQGRQ